MRIKIEQTIPPALQICSQLSVPSGSVSYLAPLVSMIQVAGREDARKQISPQLPRSPMSLSSQSGEAKYMD